MSDMASVYERHRITLDEYHRMAKAGVFDAQARIELIDGELIENELVAYREPTDAWYASVNTYCRGDRISPFAFPDVNFAVTDLLPAS